MFIPAMTRQSLAPHKQVNNKLKSYLTDPSGVSASNNVKFLFRIGSNPVTLARILTSLI